MADFKITVVDDLPKFRRTLSYFERRALPTAAQQAFNRAGKSAFGVSIKQSAKDLGLKQAAIKRGFTWVKAKAGRLRALIKARGRPLNLILFTGRAETRARAFKRGGVRAKVKGTWQVFPGTFIANQGRTVFRRLSKIRTHLEGVTGGSVPETLASSSVKRAIDRKFGERWPVELRRALDNQLRRRR